MLRSSGTLSAAHSRFMVAKMIPTRHTQDLLLAM